MNKKGLFGEVAMSIVVRNQIMKIMDGLVKNKTPLKILFKIQKSLKKIIEQLRVKE